MKEKIVQNAKQILVGVQYDFDLAFKWDDAYFERYDRYFSHPDVEVRKYALLVFVGALGNWYLQSAHVFKWTPPSQANAKVYQFEHYVRAFLQHKEAIQQEFPLLYRRILWYLCRLDEREPFQKEFDFTNRKLLSQLRLLFKSTNIDTGKFQDNFEQIINELNLSLK